jgi:XrtJ-associated TM-motif-TM protein
MCSRVSLNAYKESKIVKYLSQVAFLTILLLALTLPVHADQGGCVDSPENPTAILGFVGAAGAGIAYLRIRIKAKTRK